MAAPPLRMRHICLPSAVLRSIAQGLALALGLLLASPGIASAQEAAAGGQAAAEVPPEPTGPVAIPISAIASQASSLDAFLRDVEAGLKVPAAQSDIAEKLADKEREILARSRRLEQKLEQSYDRGDLDAMQSSWRGTESDLGSWESSLETRLSSLGRRETELDDRSAIWEKTAEEASAQKAPAAVRSEVAEARKRLTATQHALRKSRDEALALQRGVVALQARVRTRLDAIAKAREEVLRHIINRSDVGVWELEAGDVDENLQSFRLATAEGRAALKFYANKHAPLLSFHGLLILALMFACSRARRAVQAAEGSLERPLPEALHRPLAAGLVLGLTITVWLHPEAPPQFGHLLGLVVLPSWFLVLRRLLPEPLRRPLIGLMIIVLVEFTRQLLIDFELIARLLMVLEAGLILAGVISLRRPSRLGGALRTGSLFWVRALGLWLHFSLIASATAVAGSLAGWTTISDMLLTAVASGSFVASILFTAVCVLEGMLEGSALTGQLHRIRLIHHDPHAFLRVVQKTGRSLALVTFLSRFLDLLSLRGPVLAYVTEILAEPLGYGNAEITLGGLLAFGIALWASWLLSRLIATFMEREVLSRVSLPRGVPFALSTISRYVVLVLGFVMAVAALGVEVGNLALLVSALGVGIGFGMQNVVNNFISGLILLFERPVKVGDRVSIDTLLGEVTRIGIRASVIRTFDGADVIVPNGDLISNQVTNWTLADTRRRVILPVGVVYGTPAQKVIDLLLGVASANPDVISDPAPIGLFVGFGDSSLDFELRIWTDSEDALTAVRSALAIAVQEALAEADIEVPFPQRDLHLKTVPGSLPEPSEG